MKEFKRFDMNLPPKRMKWYLKPIANLIASAPIKEHKPEVTLQKYNHSESVYSYKFKGTAQDDRNPFVDYPELVDYVYGSKKDEPSQLKYLELKICI